MRDETELEAVRRARDSILANISHEFRTPLAAQQASIELLRDGLADMPREQLEELVDSLQRGTLRLTRLIDNLLESVRIESGQLAHPPPAGRAGAGRGGRAGTDRRPAGAAAPGVAASNCPADLPLVQGDAQRLTQVVTNLLANANKFGPEGSEIVRRCARRPAASVSLWVEDEGPGVPEPGRRLDLRALLPLRRPGARAARPRPRAVDRQVDRRSAWRPHRASSAPRQGARASP